MLHPSPLLKHSLACGVFVCLLALSVSAIAFAQATAVSSESTVSLAWPWQLVFSGLICLGIMFNNSRQLAQEAEFDQPFAKIFDDLPVPMAIMRISDFVFLAANQEFQRLTRLTLGDLVGKTHQELGIELAPADQQQFFNCILLQPRVRNYELHVRFLGHELVLLISSEHISFNGEPCLLGSFQNITARQQAEERFAKAFHANPISMTILSCRDYRIIETNASTLKLMGLTLAEIQGKTLRELKVGIAPETWREITARLVAAGKISDYEFKVLYQGRERILLAGAEYIEFNGESCILWSQQDITERKRAEERFAKAFYANPMPMCISRASDLRFIAVNDSTLHFTGYTREEMLGKTRCELGMVAAEAEEQVLFERLQTAGAVRDFEMNVNLQGNSHALLVSVESIVLNDEPCWLWATQDITERKQAEERFAKAFDANPNPMALISRTNQRFVQINQAWAQKSGLAVEQVVGRTTDEINLWAQPEQRQEYYRLLEETGHVRDFEANAVLPDGQQQTFLLCAEPLNLNGQPHLLTCSFDITERKRAEENLRKSELRYRSLIEDQTEFITRWRPDGIRTFVNDSYCRFFGVAREEALQTSWFPAIADAAGQEDLAKMAALTPAQPLHEAEHFRYVQGQPTWTHWSNRALFDAAGQIIEYQSVGRDITERKLAEKALRNSEDLYRRLIEDQTEFVSRWLPDGTRTFVNNSYLRFCREIGEHEVLGTSWFENMPPEDAAQVHQQIAALSPAQPVCVNENRTRKPNGELVWVQWSNRAFFDEAGRAIEYQSVGRDITERKQAEERFAKAFYENGVPMSIVRADDDVIIEINRAYTTLTGWSREEVLGKTCAESGFSFSAEDAQGVVAELRSAGKINPLEVTACFKTGVKTLLSSASLMSFNGTECVLWSEQDITERKQAEEIAQRWHSVFSQTKFGLAHINISDNKILDVNEAFARLRGYTRAELIGQPIFIVYPPAEHARITQVFAEVNCTGHGVLETVHQRKDGSCFPVMLELTILRNAQGQPVSRITYSIDITERKQVEAALQTSEAQFRALAETSLSAILIYDENDNFIYANPASEQLFGYTPAELTQHTIWDVIHPDSRSDVAQRQTARLRGEPVAPRNEIMICNQQGQTRWVDYSIGSIEFAGHPCLIVTAFDITERKQAEDDLRASEIKFRTLAESSQIGISIYNEEGFIYVNPALERLYGYTREEFTRLTWRDLVHPDSRQEAEVRWLTRQQIGQDYSRGEMKLQNKAGNPLWINYSIGTMELAGQRYTIATSFDISERKRAEEELRVSEERFAAAFNASPDAMAITTFDEGRYVLVNDAWVRIFGVSRAEALGQQFRNLKIWVDDVQRFFVFNQVRTGGSVVDYEVTGQTSEGRPITLLITAKLIRLGAEKFVLSVSKDITERKGVEVELQTSQAQLRNLAGRLQTIREEERAAIAREIHDELGQALTGIKMDLKWLERLLPPETGPARERLSSIYSLIGNTVQSVRQLATSLRPGVLDDFGLVAALEWQARDFTARTGIACDFDELPEEVPLDSAHATALFRIFQETLTNVARHAEATRINARLNYEHNNLHLQIHDNGKGISTDEIKHSRSLGLIGMRERALLLGGTFSVEGGPGRGTTIDVQLPLAVHSRPDISAEEDTYDSHLDR